MKVRATDQAGREGFTRRSGYSLLIAVPRLESPFQSPGRETAALSADAGGIEGRAVNRTFQAVPYYVPVPRVHGPGE